jgi:hypothetical protein
MTNPNDIKLAHVKEMAEAAAENGHLFAQVLGDLITSTDPEARNFKQKSSDARNSNFALHKKTSWLFDPKVFEEAKAQKDLAPCEHVDPISPGFYFYLLGSYPEKTVLCVGCSADRSEKLSEMFPDKCDLCDTTPHQIFHEALVNVGAINIYGNVCGDCANNYLKN